MSLFASFFVDSFFKDNPSMSMINDSDEEIYKCVTFITIELSLYQCFPLNI